jgi:hypothetical protein
MTLTTGGPFGDDERDAVVRLLDEIRRACNGDVGSERVWRLVGVVGAIAGMASSDLRDGHPTQRIHRHVDLLNEAVAQLEARPEVE